MRVLVIDCGSATLKYKLFEDRNAGRERLAAAVVETAGRYRAAVGQVLAALPALEGIEATLGSGVPLIAALDSAFRGTLPPRAWRVRRRAPLRISRLVPPVRHRAIRGADRLVRAHDRDAAPRGWLLRRRLRRGRSVDTSMGYSPLEGLVMGTRAGDLDPGILTHSLHEGMSLREIDAFRKVSARTSPPWKGRRPSCSPVASVRTRRRSGAGCANGSGGPD
jgi:hypothetical protein